MSVLFTPTQQQIQQFSAARMSRDARFDGTFYIAVKSTGIFCRPVCPARLPAEANVHYFLHATQALAEGYRPCLRCRPDSAPHSPAWEGVNTTVKRAQTLLSEIPGQPIPDVADRLGISERYLHKLMRTHVGINPKTFQNYQRVLFAKQLLQQSQLPVMDVAVASGFDSIRQLQRMMQQYCKLTPSQLRQAEPTPQTVNAPVVKVRMAYRPPYNWPAIRDFLAIRAVEGTERITDDSYQRCLRVSGKPVLVKARHVHQNRAFDVEIHLQDLAHAHSILRRLARVLDIDADPLSIEMALENAGLSSSDITPGLRLAATWSRFEAGCRAILGQQVTVKAAITQLSRLTALCGTSSEYGLMFPTPQQIAQGPLEELKMPNGRREALRAYAQLFAEQGNDDVDAEAIGSIKGIGPWTLAYLKLRGDHHPDCYLHGDLIVRQQAAKRDLHPYKATPWQSYLTLQLWQLASVACE